VKKKILYVASTQSHLMRFHKPYLEALQKSYEVKTMATGKDIDFPVLFDKHFFSFANLRSIGRIRAILKKEKFDAVMVHTTLAAFLVRAAMWGWGKKKRPYVLNTVHGYLFSKPYRGLRDRVLYLCERMLRSKTDAIAVMNGEDHAIATQNRLCLGSVVMTRGMGIPHPTLTCDRDTELRARFAGSDECLCTFVGELSNRKNQRFLIEAVKRLRDGGLPIRLLLLGEGSEREALERMTVELGLEGAVFMPGNVEPVTPYLAVTDLYVSASCSEGLPFNIMEAMAMGLPIVASEVRGQTDLLRESPDCLYRFGDTDAFCNLVRKTLQSGACGAHSHSYPQLAAYGLQAVFSDNLELFTAWDVPQKEV